MYKHFSKVTKLIYKNKQNIYFFYIKILNLEEFFKNILSCFLQIII